MKYLLISLLVMLSGSTLAYDYADESEDQDSLPYVEILPATDFHELGRDARLHGKVIMLMMSANYCSYCELLEEAIVKPMLRSGDYTNHVLIRKLEIDRHYPIRHFNGNSATPASLANEYDVFVTPTLVFLDHRGREVSERILGINSLDFFGGYVDEALSEGHRKIQQNLSLNEHATQ